jgi:hypothetical protein
VVVAAFLETILLVWLAVDLMGVQAAVVGAANTLPSQLLINLITLVPAALRRLEIYYGQYTRQAVHNI